MKALAVALVLGFVLALWLTGGREAVQTFATPDAVLLAQEEARQALKQEQFLRVCPTEVTQEVLETQAVQWTESRRALSEAARE